MNKLIVLFFIIIVSRTLIGCCKDDGYGFRWSQVTVTNLDHTTDRPVPLAGNSSQAGKYGIRLSFREERVAYNMFRNFSFNEANAFDCRSFFENKDSITAIDAVTRYDFDSTHPAGSSVTAYLLARPSEFYQYHPQYQYRSVQENLSFLNENQEVSIHNNSIDLKFNNTSPNPGQHRFVITVSFKSGRTLVDSTSVQFN